MTTPSLHQCAHAFLKDELMKLTRGERVTVGVSTFENAFSEPQDARDALIGFQREYPGWRVDSRGPMGSYIITRPFA